jgi:hypothetical protein
MGHVITGRGQTLDDEFRDLWLIFNQQNFHF